jgi:hypothetical protein
VWDFTPRPTAEGREEVTERSRATATVKNNELHIAVVGLIETNYLIVIGDLVKLNKPQKA